VARTARPKPVKVAKVKVPKPKKIVYKKGATGVRKAGHGTRVFGS